MRNPIIIVVILLILFGVFDRGERVPYGYGGGIVGVLVLILVLDLVFHIL